MTHVSTRYRHEPRWFWLFLAWGSISLPIYLGPLIYLHWVVMLGLIIFAFWRRSWRPMFVIILSPFAIGFISGALSWFGQRPCYITWGLPETEFYNLDPHTRTYWESLGDLLDGSEPAKAGPHNLGLNLMCRAFGKPPRTYSGVYPTREEADLLTRSAMETPITVFEKGQIILPSGSLDIDERQSSAMLKTCWISKAGNSSFHKISVRVIQADEDALLIRLTVDAEDRAKFLESDHVFLLDRKRLWPFAIYALKERLGGTRYPYFSHRNGASELLDLSNLPPEFSGPLY